MQAYNILAIMDFFRKLKHARAMLSLVLIAFLLMRAIVPAGFMPSDGSTGSLYMYCFGDSGARQLIDLNQNTTSQNQHDHHAHHGQHLASTSSAATATHATNEHAGFAPTKFCEYATFSAQLILWALVVLVLGWAKSHRIQPARQGYYQPLPAYFLPAVRAPPAIIFIE